MLLIKDAPPRVNVPDLKSDASGALLRRSGIRNRSSSRRRSPSSITPGAQNSGHTRYERQGGFPISSFLVRLAAAVSMAT